MNERPRPSVTRGTEFFWDAVNERRLVVQRCRDCSQLRFPPLPSCPHCGSCDWDSAPMSGRGFVHSFIVPRTPPPSYMPENYIVALVELTEGPRLVTNLLDVEPADVAIGMSVDVCFEQLDDDTAIVQFRPAADVADARR